jgi:hypothetical protein
MKSKALIDAITGVTKKWTKLAMTRCRMVSIREAAWRVMETAFMQASANGTLPANASPDYVRGATEDRGGGRSRQVFHANASARPHQASKARLGAQGRVRGGGRCVRLPAKPQLDRDGKAIRDQRTGKLLCAPVLEFSDWTARFAFSIAVVAALLDYAPNVFAEESTA